jgi:hypothetical protein
VPLRLLPDLLLLPKLLPLLLGLLEPQACLLHQQALAGCCWLLLLLL